jgi:hypothetical protein
MVVVKQIYDDNKKMWDYDLKFIENDSPVSAFEDQLEAYIEEVPEPKFKVGDRVKFPKDQFGKEVYSFAMQDAKGEGKNYLTIKEISETNKVVLENQNSGETTFTYNYDGLELYEEEVPEIPEKIIRKGEFFQRNENVWLATEDSRRGRGYQYIVRKSFRYIEARIFSKGAIFQNTLLTKRKFGEIQFDITYSYTDGFSFFLKKADLKIDELNVKNLGIAETIAQRIILFLATVDRDLSDEYEKIWKKIEEGVERGIIRADWRTTKTDCEADQTKIVSSQVKRFYDLNKNRIDKLNPEFSCLIVKALVSLSDYESCGRPSSDSLPKPKNDLLSDIKNFTL